MAEDSHKWFASRIRDKRLSQRALAKLLDMDPSSLSLLLHGKRRMRVEQAAEIARLLGVPVGDVMRHAGADVRDVVAKSAGQTIPVVGWIDGNYKATLDWSSTGHRVEVSGDFPPTAVAIQFRTAQTRADLADGWIVVTLPPREPDPESMLDRYCVVGLKNGGAVFLRTVRRGYTPGRFTLLDFFSEPMHDVELAWFAPVLTIKPT